VSVQLQAELYAVLVSLPGVGFTGDAVDAAGRSGIGLHLMHGGHLDVLNSGIVSKPGQVP
jgi:hypothetical protein